jgi:hypothetical protein
MFLAMIPSVMFVAIMWHFVVESVVEGTVQG